ncbi:MAG: hypothetical protein KF901_24540 [Myxococcales bacterium]|nr:hypothetical protein [Myxococcales bacterium]
MTITHAERLQVKLYASATPPAGEDLVPVFHRWIREHVVDDDTLIDVVDYGHVKDGPGVALIGHGADYFYDESEGRKGLLFFRKRALEGDLRGRLQDAFTRTLEGAARLEGEGALDVAFGRDEVLVRILDRLHAPNDDASYAALEPLVREVAEAALGGAVTLERVGAGTKGPLSVRVRRA